MPFWHGDTAGRPAEFGRKIGAMTRELLAQPRPVAFSTLVTNHSLDTNAAENLLAISRRPSRRHRPRSQRSRHRHRNMPRRTRRPPHLRAHSVWHSASTRRGAWPSPPSFAPNADWKSNRCGPTTASSFASPKATKKSASEQLLPDPNRIPATRAAATRLHFPLRREISRGCARALLLPRRRAGQRTPLWQQRKRAADLARRRFALFFVPDLSRNLSRMHPRRFRSAGRLQYSRRDSTRRNSRHQHHQR